MYTSMILTIRWRNISLANRLYVAPAFFKPNTVAIEPSFGNESGMDLIRHWLEHLVVARVGSSKLILSNCSHLKVYFRQRISVFGLGQALFRFVKSINTRFFPFFLGTTTGLEIKDG